MDLKMEVYELKQQQEKMVKTQKEMEVLWLKQEQGSKSLLGFSYFILYRDLSQYGTQQELLGVIHSILYYVSLELTSSVRYLTLNLYKTN